MFLRKLLFSLYTWSIGVYTAFIIEEIGYCENLFLTLNSPPLLTFNAFSFCGRTDLDNLDPEFY
jgi:hypothetical protein